MELLGIFLRLALRGPNATRSRAGFEAWYAPRRADPGASLESKRVPAPIATPVPPTEAGVPPPS